MANAIETNDILRRVSQVMSKAEERQRWYDVVNGQRGQDFQLEVQHHAPLESAFLRAMLSLGEMKVFLEDGSEGYKAFWAQLNEYVTPVERVPSIKGNEVLQKQHRAAAQLTEEGRFSELFTATRLKVERSAAKSRKSKYFLNGIEQAYTDVHSVLFQL